MSVAFTKEDSAEAASETLLPDRPISPHPNLVTAAGLAALGQGKVAGAACDSLGRNPAARPGIMVALILGLAFIESLVLFTLVIIFVKVA